MNKSLAYELIKKMRREIRVNYAQAKGLDTLLHYKNHNSENGYFEHYLNEEERHEMHKLVYLDEYLISLSDVKSATVKTSDKRKENRKKLMK
jgi:hypothetical protein